MDIDIVDILSQIPATTIIDYTGVVIGVLAGSLFAIERKLDVVGVVSLGLVTAFGGGIIRDLLLQDQGIFFMEHPMAILASMCISIVLSMARRHLIDFYQHLFYIDAFTMAWYALAGASKSWFGGAGAVISIILGSLTAVGGGMLRDISVGEVPKIFKPGKYYAISGFVGAVFYVMPRVLGLSHEIASILCVAVGFGLTVFSRRFDWHTTGEALAGGSADTRMGERAK